MDAFCIWPLMEWPWAPEFPVLLSCQLPPLQSFPIQSIESTNPKSSSKFFVPWLHRDTLSSPTQKALACTCLWDHSQTSPAWSLLGQPTALDPYVWPMHSPLTWCYLVHHNHPPCNLHRRNGAIALALEDATAESQRLYSEGTVIWLHPLPSSNTLLQSWCPIQSLLSPTLPDCSTNLTWPTPML